MTEEKPFRYLSREDIAAIHGVLTEGTRDSGEPVPPFTLAKASDIEALVHAPQKRFNGADLYPTLEEKAAILFYSVNKQQIFLNGNKRMSTLCLIVFLGINNKLLQLAPDELTAKALWLANTPSLDFPVIKTDLAAWIAERLIDWPGDSETTP